MLEVLARNGYSRTTVPAVVAAARASRNAFYELFSDKEDCFLAACDQEADDLIAAIVSVASRPRWTGALRDGMRIYLRWWQDRPELTRAYFLEIPAAGARAVRQRERGYRRFEQIFAVLAARAREEQPELAPLSPVVPRFIVIAITEFIAAEVRAGRGDRLVELEADLLFAITRLLAATIA